MLSFDHIIHQLFDLSSYNYFSSEESDQKIDSFKNIGVKLSSHVYGQMNSFSDVYHILELKKFNPKYVDLLSPEDYSFYFGLIEIIGFSKLIEDHLITYEPLLHFYDENGNNQLVLDVYEDNNSYYFEIDTYGEKWMI